MQWSVDTTVYMLVGAIGRTVEVGVCCMALSTVVVSVSFLFFLFTFYICGAVFCAAVGGIYLSVMLQIYGKEVGVAVCTVVDAAVSETVGDVAVCVAVLQFLPQ